MPYVGNNSTNVDGEEATLCATLWIKKKSTKPLIDFKLDFIYDEVDKEQ